MNKHRLQETFARNQQSAYSLQFEMWKRKFPEVFADIVIFMDDALVIDVGGGHHDSLKEFALSSGAFKYVKVDPEIFEVSQTDKTEDFKMPISDFLKNTEVANKIGMKSKKTVFFLNGLDGVGYDAPDLLTNPHHFSDLVFQILQIASVNGGQIVGVNSPGFVEQLEEVLPKESGVWNIFPKTSNDFFTLTIESSKIKSQKLM